MRYTDITAFQKHLQSSGNRHLMQLYLLIAEDHYDVQLATKALIRIVLGTTDSQSMGEVRLDLSSKGAKSLINELNSFNLFAARRLIIAERLESLSTEQQKALLPALNSIPNKTILILCASSMKSNTTFYKSIEKAGVILDLCTSQKPWERDAAMQQWVIGYALEIGKKISMPAAKVLVSLFGGERARLGSELSKLACFLGEREEIQTTDIAQVCEGLHLESVWQLCDAIFSKQASKALSILGHLLVDNSSFFLLLRQIRSQFHVKCHVAALLESGEGRDAISSAYSYMRGNILEQAVEVSSKYGLAALQRGLVILDQVELKAKNQNCDQQILAELLIVKLTGK